MAVRVAVAVAVAVRVAVAVAVRVAVAVGVAVRFGVGVGVGFFFFLAEPINWTLADLSPAVASLLTLMLAEKLLPESGGANSTVTVAAACG